MISPIQKEEIHSPVVIMEEDARSLWQTVAWVSPVIFEYGKGNVLDRVFSIVIVQAIVVIVPYCQVGYAAEYGLERGDVSLVAILFSQKLPI